MKIWLGKYDAIQSKFLQNENFNTPGTVISKDTLRDPG